MGLSVGCQWACTVLTNVLVAGGGRDARECATRTDLPTCKGVARWFKVLAAGGWSPANVQTGRQLALAFRDTRDDCLYKVTLGIFSPHCDIKVWVIKEDEEIH